MKKFIIRWSDLQQGSQQEEIIECETLKDAEETAKESWFNTNEVWYFAEELEKL